MGPIAAGNGFEQLHRTTGSLLPLPSLLLLLLLCFFGCFYPANSQSATLACTDEHRITVDFENGAGWDLCWESKRRENLVLSDIHFKSAGSPFNDQVGNQASNQASNRGFSQANDQYNRVISSLRLAQLHVTYDDGLVTFNDVTQFGLGGGRIATLDEFECPAGELIRINDNPGLCKQITRGDDAFRTVTESRPVEALTLFSVSHVGAYSYLVTFKLYDDGSIESSVGAAGALQRSSDDQGSLYGRELEDTPGKSWLSHTHNYYWRVDFDLGENAADDVASEVSFITDDDGRRARSVERLDEEAAREISPETMRSWYITDGSDDIASAKGYVIEPLRYGHKLVRTDIEPFTLYDFFVTRQNDCERFVTENSNFNPQCGDNILDFIDGESVVDEDIVVWHRVSFHHVPRNEDRHHMHSHWDGFLMQARNFSLITPGHSGVVDNSAPVLAAPQHLQHELEELVSVELTFDDADGDELIFSATDLPDGVSLTRDGVLQGRVIKAGNYRAVVTVKDKKHTSNALIQWQVSGEKSSIGALSLLLLPFTLLILIYSRLNKRRSYS